MANWQKFLKSKRQWWGSFALFHLTFLLVSLLLYQNLLLFIYVLVLNSFLSLVYLVLAYPYYQEQLSTQKQMHQLKKEHRNLQDQWYQFKSDLSSYFLIWIHQIKTPITAVMLLAAEEEPSRQTLNDIRIQTLRIDNYTQTALNYLKLLDEEVALDLTDIDLDQVLRKIIKYYAPLFIEAQIHLNFSPSQAIVVTDGQWLTILLEQLIDNAVKYSPQGQIDIYYQTEERALVIQDSGRGIHPHDLPLIFSKGYAGMNGRLNKKSTGIGLYIVQVIAQRLQLEIKVESKLKQGSKFLIYFPKNSIG
ncbi:HAMP domain-containing histidine kinase [Ignavigranum ruoffiae]|uniref:sensor histidine kinase n=1 Tax=Ignavigranum ruoffiae TaxID=89093 RepID=UPI00206FBA6E|nr:HAMP domain-containing sensor histidine kinase [Ignavigranum ruoffiae]UPQ84983.1 HAMP domain-containing histidine kinase [Ignavigranum ruoffiae]